MGCQPALPSGLAQTHSSKSRRAAGSVPPVSLHIWSRCSRWSSVPAPTPRQRLWHLHLPSVVPWLLSWSWTPPARRNWGALGSPQLLRELEEEEGAVMLCDGCGNTHLCTPAWREEDEEPKGISWVCPLHRCPCVPQWHRGCVSPDRTEEIMGNKILGDGKMML